LSSSDDNGRWKRQATRGITVSIDEGLAIETSCFARMVPTRDIEEGMSAWLEKELERIGARTFPKRGANKD
jgi:enoyl-CoA hydratase/carnithine racemase